jgi:protein-tyrosine phosphatase
MDDSNLKFKMLEEQKKRIMKTGLVRNYINEIIPNLFLGDLGGALDNKDTFDIIINLSQHKYSTKCEIYDINIDDNPSVNIIEYVEKCIPIIECGLKENKKILIHCFAGKSRSASIMIGYFMKTNKLDYDTTVALINEKREHQIAPNIGFMVQLKKYYSIK